MSFDEDQNDSNEGSNKDSGKPKTFFGFEIGDGVVYAIVIVLALIFIRQASVVLAAL
jgi:hypothetical protein